MRIYSKKRRLCKTYICLVLLWPTVIFNTVFILIVAHWAWANQLLNNDVIKIWPQNHHQSMHFWLKNNQFHPFFLSWACWWRGWASSRTWASIWMNTVWYLIPEYHIALTPTEGHYHLRMLHDSIWNTTSCTALLEKDVDIECDLNNWISRVTL